jgi:hypothetical protein
LQQIRWHKIGSNKIWHEVGSNVHGEKLVPTNTAGKTEEQGIGSNQYGGKLISTNTARNILRETVPTKTAGHWFQSMRQEIGSNQYSRKTKQQGIGSNQYKYSGNWFQQMQWEIFA